MTELCQCTKDLMHAKAFDVARIRLVILYTPLNAKGPKDNQQAAGRM